MFYAVTVRLLRKDLRFNGYSAVITAFGRAFVRLPKTIRRPSDERDTSEIAADRRRTLSFS